MAATNPDNGPTESDFHQAIARRGNHWYSACLRITRSPELAGDAVQDALLNAWRKRDQFQGDARLETWIHRIAVNAALDQMRSQHPERWAVLDQDVADDSPDPESEKLDEELEGALQRAMHGLSEIERVCFTLKHLEQWRLQEISESLNASLGTVKQAVFRACKKLRVSMSDLRTAS